ncbi:MAG: hypothetical protein R3F19_18610 [Verrucomicrobiales bacterium]|nr:hypothetical protein [Verrucomicrobiae bacterium]
MKKLLTLACSLIALAAPVVSHADTEGISYDYVQANWAFSSFDLDGFDESNGAQLGLSVSIADNAYISLFGTIQDDTSNAGFGIGLHHELVESVDLTTEVGGFYQDIVEDFGAYTELGARWYSCKWFELGASVGLDYIDSEANFYGRVTALVPVYKGLSFVATTKLEEEGQTYGAGFRFNF